MHKSKAIFDKLQQCQLIALLNPQSVEECIHAYEILNQEGLVLEIALRSQYALDGIKAIQHKNPEALVLAGTVMTASQAESAINAGVAGVLSADYIPEVIDVCVRNDVMVVPGGLTDAGKQLVRKATGYDYPLEELKQKYPYQWVYKLFPTFAGQKSQMDFAKAWHGPYKDLRVIYAGGITVQNLTQLIRYDPQGIFCASALIQNPNDTENSHAQIKKWKEIVSSRTDKPLMVSEPISPKKAKKSKVVTFGELMARLSPPQGERLQNATHMDLHFGGAEANVAVSLAGFGMDACFVTALPRNDIGNNAFSTLRKHGVNTQYVLRQGQRIGIYYLEHGSGPRPSQVIYDRAHSAISQITHEDLNWEKILNNAAWFHWTGITPALGTGVASLLRKGLETANAKKIPVSVDLNFRSKLWSEQEANAVMSELMPFVDICIGNEEDAMKVFGLQSANLDVDKGKLNISDYEKTTQLLIQRFGFKKVAITLRESLSASENRWSACLHNGKEFVSSTQYHVWITDRIGTGDAFAAGLIFSLLQDKNDKSALEFAVAAAVLKHTISGDFNLVNVDEVENLVSGVSSGRIQR